MASLDGKVAIVTGSSSGIGMAIARSLHAEGVTVVVNSARSVEAGTALAEELGSTYVQADVSDGAHADRLVAATVEAHGRLDILVNNAGTTEVIPHHDLAAVTDEVWHRILDVNVLGTWKVTCAAVPHLEASGAGSVVNITSIAGVRPRGSSIPYAVSKAADMQLARALAVEWGPKGIRVNSIAPGLVKTDFARALWEDPVNLKKRTRDTPLLRIGEPDEIAGAAIFLASPAASYMVGSVLTVDGGWTAK